MKSKPLSFILSTIPLSALFLLPILFIQCQQKISEPTLHHLVRPAAEGVENPPAVILLHGYRSNAENFFSLSKSISDQFTVISVQGPLEKDETAFAWYELLPNSYYDGAELEKARLSIIEFIEQVSEKYKLNKENIYLCGFSQGAIMSYAVGLTRPDLVKGIAPLSGRIAKETSSSVSKNEDLKALRVFIAHGDEDKVISVKESRAAKAFFTAKGMETTYVEERKLGHSINQNILKSLLKWLETSN